MMLAPIVAARISPGPNGALPFVAQAVERLPSAADARLRTASRSRPGDPEPPRRAAAPPRAATSAVPTTSGRSSSTMPTPGTRSRPARPRRSAEAGPDAVVAGSPRWAPRSIAARPGVVIAGIGVPGLYDPATGATRFLVNVPGAWAGRPVAGPVGAALGLPGRSSSTTPARSGWRSSGSARAAAPTSMVGLTLGTGVGGVIAVDGRVHQGHDGTAGEVGHQTIDPDGPWCGCGNHGCLEAYARADQLAAACGIADRRGGGGPRPGRRRAGARGAGTDRPLPRHRHREPSSCCPPDRVVIGGGVAAAGDLLFPPIRAELAARVRTTSLDAVTVVPAELGTGRARSGRRSTARSGRGGAGARRVTWRRLRPAVAADRARAARADHGLTPGDPLPSDTAAVRGVRRSAG